MKHQELKTKSRTDFDRAYVEAMVKDHHDDLQAFIDEQKRTFNLELKAVVTIRKHAMMIDNIAHMGGIETPPMSTGI